MKTATKLQHLYAEMVALGGGTFRGVQAGFKQHPELILFDDASAPREQRSTMALTPASLSADAVRSAIREQREVYEKFDSFAEKACTRVLQQFGPEAA